ncbi:methionine--tRNA ligase [Algimonas ampicilliniresistens]|uniref:Methionine--tRNA ligase n=1 Tax=Algimonas ampicilliniresistens TaxID=1298735 RepID=A0ABQ5VEA0_9PROT|nr:methionine--tRNA ligase [Algimonas ampicilliniresistens]GLQ24742.1 methionine--tRNA ligase [Algimonas ampicilliniresistens]
MSDSQSRILITSALPYINGVKHLGNLAGSMLPADVYARVMRLLGHDVLYICATDEHGTPAELAAAEAGMAVAEYCALMHEKQREAGAAFDLSYDWFGRSSSEATAKLTQQFSATLEQNGLIEARISKQVYSNADGRYLPDRYVEGTCPNCAFEKARGDQCDNCGKLLDPIDLIDPYSSVSGSHDVEVRETEHLYLKQSEMSDKLRVWVEAQTSWPPLATSIALKWLDEGLRDRSITRDLDWGIPVVDMDGNQRAGFDGKVYYVWFDAPIAYIGATQDWAADTGGDWARWWRTDQGADDVTYVQFMGKDNVAFHTLSFPTTLMGANLEEEGEPWKLVDTLKAFNWVTWYGGKFSTSNKRGVFMDQAIALAPSDCWRWHLMANAPESSDAAFTWEEFQASVNSDLANVLGNFVNRITKYTVSKFDGQVPDGGVSGGHEDWIIAEVSTRLPLMIALFEAREFRKALGEMRAIWAAGNEYLTRAAPWTHYKTDVDQAAVGVRMGLNLVSLFGIIAQPIIPRAAKSILDAMNIPEAHRNWSSFDGWANGLPVGLPVAAPDVLFAKIEDTQIEDWTEQFGGDAEVQS